MSKMSELHAERAVIDLFNDDVTREDMEGPQRPRCDACAFVSKRTDQFIRFYCRRNPISLDGFPATKPEFWCGEFKRKA